MGKAVKAVTKVASPVLGGAGGLLFGRKQVQEADPIAAQLFETQGAASGLQKSSIDELSRRLKEDPTNLFRAQLANQERNLQGSKEDARRNIEALVRQRGLGNTSAGLSALLGAQNDINRQIAVARAQSPIFIDEIKRQRLMDALGGANAVVGSQKLPINLRRQSGRSGGILPAITGGIGAALGGSSGGPQGAAAGGSAGLGIGQALIGAF